LTAVGLTSGFVAQTAFADATNIDTTTTLNTITAPLTAGQTGVAFPGHVSVTSPAANVPNGAQVKFGNVSNSNCTGSFTQLGTALTVTNNGSFSGTFTAPAAGTYYFRADFDQYNVSGGPGGTNWKQSSSACQTVVFNVATTITTTTIISSTNPSIYGVSVTFTAAVSPNTGTTTPTGSVQFVIDGGSPLTGTSVSCPGGTPANSLCATYATSSLTVNGGVAHTVQANYTHTGSFANSSGSLVGGQTVTKATATCTVNAYNVTYDGTEHTDTGSCAGVGSDTTPSGLVLSGTKHTNAATTRVMHGPSPTSTITMSTARCMTRSTRPMQPLMSLAIPAHTMATRTARAARPATGVGSVDLSGSLNLGATFINVPGGTAHWTFSGGANYNDASGNTNIVIDKANASCTITGYHVTYDGAAHIATGSCAGVNSETPSGLDLSGTTHTNVGDYTSDTWTFTNINYNDASGTVHDHVSAWSLNGFYAPVGIPNTYSLLTPSQFVWNTIKGGSTVPLKFNIFADSVEKTTTAAIKSVTTQPINGTSSGSGIEDTVDFTTSGGTSLRYSGTPGVDGQFIQNWQTPKVPAICYRIVVTTQDNSMLVSFFKTK
jgi:hypothetical protein